MRYFSLLLFSVLIMTSCATLTGMLSMVNCNYDIRNVTNPELLGISLTNVSDVTKLDAVSMLRLTTSILAGSLPLSATVNVGINNPNASAAQIGGLDWELYFNNAGVLSGSTAQNIYVAPNGGVSTIPLNLQVDIMNFVKRESREEVFDFVNGLLHLGENASSVALRIRPTLTIGGQNIRTGFITVTKNI